MGLAGADVQNPGTAGSEPGAVPLTLKDVRELLAKPENSTLDAGHEWKLEQATENGLCNLNYEGDSGLSAKQCVKIATQGAGSQAALGLTRLAAMNLKGKFLRFYFKVPAGATANMLQFGVQIGSGAAAFTAKWNINAATSFTANQLEVLIKTGEWVSFTINPAGPTKSGEANWEAVQDLRITLEDNGLGKTELLFGGVQICPVDERFPNGVCSITCDDNYGSQYSAIAPYLTSHAMKASLYLTFDRIGAPEKLTIAQIEHLIQVNGWDASVHCYEAAHNVNPETGMTTLSAGVISSDLSRARSFMRANGLRDPNHFAIPSGKFDSEMLAIMRAGFASARSTASTGVETIPPADPLRLRIIRLGQTVAEIEAQLKLVHEFGGWAIFLFHNVAAKEETNTITEAKFHEIIAAITASGIPVRKVSEVLGA